MSEKQNELIILKEKLSKLKELQKNIDGDMTILRHIAISNEIKEIEEKIKELTQELKQSIHNTN